ncbi:MAG TPA: SpoIIE family protein phosphatase [Spirochaetota bacterium]|nr:SpoIIE family protein phosphatase [Spirochaetota bacterium]
MKKILFTITAGTILLSTIHGAAAAINLDREAIYVRRGFEAGWVNALPSPDDSDWLVIPGVASGTRKVVLKELPLKGMPERTFLSLKKYQPENFTFLTSFAMDEKGIEMNGRLGIYFANIGENWAVYLNGRLVRSEIHINGRGEITGYRHSREVAIPVDPRLLRPGINVLAARIIGDPTNIDSGFHRSTPFVIDSMEEIEKQRSEQTTMILVFLYLFLGIYHLFIFIRRRDELFNLYYALFSTLLFIYILSRTHTIYEIISDSTILHRIEYCSLYTLIPLIGAFLDLLPTGSYSRLTKICSAFYALLIIITVMPVSNMFAIDILRVWQVSAIIPLFYYLIVRIGGKVYQEWKRIYGRYRSHGLPYRVMKTTERTLTSTTAGNILSGAIILAACSIFDIADSLFWAYDVVLTQYGFFAFTMGMTLILANRFLKTHRELEMSNEIAAIEMELAANMQKMLLPPVPAGIEQWDIAMSFVPKYGASGDFYDFYYSGKELQGIALFDVSGHGVSSALITMMVKPVTFRIFNAMQGESLEKIMNLVNEHISHDLSRLDNFVTSILVRMTGNRVEYVNAGHPDLLHRAHATGDVRIIDAGGKNFRGEPLGLAINHHRPSAISFTVGKNDLLLLFTDCILDARNQRKERYGMDRLMTSLAEAPDGSAAEVLDFLLLRFNSFVRDIELRDDFTVIVAKKTS